MADDVVVLQAAKADAAKKYAATARRSGPGGALIAVTDNARATALDVAATAAGTSRCPHTIGVDCADIRLVYNNAYATHVQPSADKDGAATITVKASVEVGGVIYRVTFGGQTAGIIDPGGSITSDPLAMEFAKGDVIYSRTFVSATSYYPNGHSSVFNGAGGWTATTDLTAPGSAAITDGKSDLYLPSAILGLAKSSTAQAWLLVGDSLVHGTGDNNFSLHATSSVHSGGIKLAGSGYAARALRGKAGTINIAMDGDLASGFSGAANHFRRAAFARHCTHALLESGRNDLTNGSTLAQVQGFNLTSATHLTRRGLKVCATTITPRTSSTDNWTTTSGQTLSAATSEPVRTAYNDWLRAGAPIDPASLAAVAVGTSGALLAGSTGHPISRVYDPADVAESSRNSGIWKPGRVITGVAATAGGTTVTTSSPMFTAADVGAPMIVVGAGTAGANTAVLVIDVVNSSTQVTLYSSSTTTAVTGSTAYIGMLTTDGTHPFGAAAILLAAALDPTLAT